METDDDDGDAYDDEFDDSDSDDEQKDEQDADELPKPCIGNCKKCLLCCYKILYRFSLNASSFTNLFVAYEYLLALSFSQVSCERIFSKLKIVKTRLIGVLIAKL